MSVVNAVPLLAAAGGDYQISRSVRLRSSASAYFNRTFGTPTNNKIWTWSGWIKRGTLSSSQGLFGAKQGFSSTSRSLFKIDNSDNTLAFFIYDDINGYLCLLNTGIPVLRDPSAWYHIVVAYDSTQATASNRVKIYWNNAQYTFSGSPTYPSQNLARDINVSGVSNYIGGDLYNNASYLDGYLTEVNFIDGQALTPSSFGENDVLTGVWKPKKYSGSYGTNGFYLNFSDNSNNTAATIGKDSSGNGNNWTPNNISVTAGTTYDSMIDVPTNYIDGGTGRGNYATLNPVNKGSNSVTLSEGNLAYTSAGGTGACRVLSTIGMTTGKWYCEFVGTGNSSYNLVGIALATESPDAGYLGASSGSYGYYASNGNKYNSGSSSAYGATYTTGDIIGIAFDADAGTLTFYKNGTSQGVAYSSIPAGTYYFGQGDYSVTFTGAFNFGQRPFSYTPPTGYKALNTQNLPDATITKGNKHFDVLTWTGDGATTRSISGLNFQPDLVWSKSRSAAYDHALYDSVRGAGSGKVLVSDTTGPEGGAVGSQDSVYGYLTSFDANGFSVAKGSSATQAFFNDSTKTYVGWNWKAGGTAVSNTAGSITSQVSANVSAGFSVVTYTGNGLNNATVGHGLNATPAMVIIKSRNYGAVGWDWLVFHKSLNTSTEYLLLNSTAAKASAAGAWSFNSSTLGFPTAYSTTNSAGVTSPYSTYVAYCFAEVAGYSKFGSYTGNGSADGPFVFCGFRPKLIMCKRTDAASDWFIMDTSRNTYNTANALLGANVNYAESTYASTNYVDFLSNGFKIRQDNYNGYQNASGGTYIYMAFAEVPFRNALAR